MSKPKTIDKEGINVNREYSNESVVTNTMVQKGKVGW